MKNATSTLQKVLKTLFYLDVWTAVFRMVGLKEQVLVVYTDHTVRMDPFSVGFCS